jgi:hypothetical protein
MASQAKHHAKNVQGWSVHVIDSLAGLGQENEVLIGKLHST